MRTSLTFLAGMVAGAVAVVVAAFLTEYDTERLFEFSFEPADVLGPDGVAYA